jgi:hypothetical protein
MQVTSMANLSEQGKNISRFSGNIFQKDEEAILQATAP